MRGQPLRHGPSRRNGLAAASAQIAAIVCLRSSTTGRQGSSSHHEHTADLHLPLSHRSSLIGETGQVKEGRN